MGILQRQIEGRLEYFEVKEGERTSCRIPAFPNMRMDIYVRCPNPVDLNVVMDDGQIMLLESGKIVRWSGRTSAGITAVEIVGDIGFWYLCQKAPLFEFNDGVPLKVEIATTEADVLKVMIEDRLRRYTAAMELNRELTEEEKDYLILDIANGDLEFDEKPDEFGLGYAERLDEYIAKQKGSEDEDGNRGVEAGDGNGAPASAQAVGEGSGQGGSKTPAQG